MTYREKDSFMSSYARMYYTYNVKLVSDNVGNRSYNKGY